MGQARAVIFFLVLAVVSLIQVSINKKKELEL
jgi:raffinose/stachyose/melibiose transport system permease protein